jgi:P pilus assembly chaperone PapD
MRSLPAIAGRRPLRRDSRPAARGTSMLPSHPRMARRPGRAALLAACAAALLAALALPGGGTARAASFQVSPTRFEFSLERRFTNFFTVTNNADKPLRLRISAAYLDADAKGALVERTGAPYDMAPWLVLNPRRITLAPSEKRVVRFSVRPPAGLAPGEYRTVVLFEELPPRPGEVTQQGMGVHIEILTRLGVTIYGTVGTPGTDPVVERPAATVAADGVHFHATARNAGTGHTTLDLQATLLAADGSAAGQATERLVVQREQERPVAFTIARPAPGAYRLQVRVREGERMVFQAELPVTVGAATR